MNIFHKIITMKINININIENLYLKESDTSSDNKNLSEDLVIQESTEIDNKNSTTTNKKFEWFVVVTQIFQSVLSTAISRIIIETFLK